MIKYCKAKQKWFAIIFTLGFLIKYNYMLIRIFHVPSMFGVIMQNLIIFVFVLFFLLPLIQEKKGRYFLYIFLLLFTGFFLANQWYNKYFGDYLSYYDIIMGQGINPVEVLVFQIIDFWEIVFIFDLCILGYLIKITEDKQFDIFNKINNWRRYQIIAGFMIFLLFFIQVFTMGSILDNRSDYNNTANFVNTYGIIPLYIYEAYNFLFTERIYAEKPEIPSFLLDEELSSSKVVPRNSNIIVIQVESLDEKVLDYEYKGEELTPFLNQLKSESLYFNNFFAQHVNGSFDGETSFLTSQYALNKHYTFKKTDMSKIPSLVNFLNKKDYNTLAFHGNERTFFYRDKAYQEIGFDRFFSLKDYDVKERSPLGVNDYEFFSQSLDYLEKEEEPFFSFFITVTSHTPFNYYPEEEYENKFNDINNTFVKNYFRSIYYTDRSIEMFFRGLEERNLLENTLIVLYGDHHAGIEEREYSSGGNFVIEQNLKEPEHIPLLIKHPNIIPDVVEKTGSPVNIAPTILDLIGEKKRPRGFVGSSLLQEGEDPVLFLHERPRVLYKGGLFMQGMEGYEKVGYLKEMEHEVEKVPEEEIEKINQIIEYTRGIFYRNL